MAQKLSALLMDAYMSNDAEEVARIKKELSMREANVRPKRTTEPIKVNTVLNDDKSSAIKIYDFLNKSLGDDWWEWEIETIEQVLWAKYGVSLSETNRDKVMAIRHVCRSDNCFSDWYEFNQVALSFAGSIADFEMLRRPSPGMVINAVKSINHIRPDRDGYFGDDVINYLCVLLIDDGIYTPAPSLVFVVKDRMKNMVSPGMKSQWLKILKRYNELVNKKNPNVGENEIDIQAKRLVNAEAASLVYG